MDPNTYLVMALLNSVSYQHKMQETTVIAKPEFIPLNVSYLKDFFGINEQSALATGYPLTDTGNLVTAGSGRPKRLVLTD
jgi:hypothetical protein